MYHSAVFCDGCANYLDQMRTAIRLTGGVDLALPPSLESRLLNAFRDWRTT